MQELADMLHNTCVDETGAKEGNFNYCISMKNLCMNIKKEKLVDA